MTWNVLFPNQRTLLHPEFTPFILQRWPKAWTESIFLSPGSILSPTPKFISLLLSSPSQTKSASLSVCSIKATAVGKFFFFFRLSQNAYFGTHAVAWRLMLTENNSPGKLSIHQVFEFECLGWGHDKICDHISHGFHLPLTFWTLGTYLQVSTGFRLDHICKKLNSALPPLNISHWLGAETWMPLECGPLKLVRKC